MLTAIIKYSLKNKFFVLLLVAALIGIGIYCVSNIPIGAVPDVTNNQVQVITTSRNLPAEDVERYLTYSVELEMANLPGVQEIRSISKFGLSVVTIVFDENLGTYLPRQLIAEKLKAVEERIPQGFGSPFMGPISTGLGEIYQYVLDVKPGYAEQYSAMDLRSIQDWIVKRQLSGIPGVVEVNTWGGYLKTYEVAVDPLKLKAMDIDLGEVYTAIQTGNGVAGGGYIEKGKEAYFIRAEGKINNLEELNLLVIANKNGRPIYVKDVGEARYGSATRFGAITGNGEGEKVLGQVMMLKGADSKRVIDEVVRRVAEVQKSLPEGVYINAFLERSELIKKTTTTVAENLIVGFLIVLLVVVFLLGNWRSGIVVASVIPLTLLFAISMMYAFGIDANLMSLGAIDFGIIIDGAVIIVEYVTFLITRHRHDLTTGDGEALALHKDQIVLQGTNKMLHSAVFGQIIIIIVFIPILTMTGVEGKMFIPMALTFCFALIGAMVLCFTYVPVMSALLIRPAKEHKTSMSDRFIHFLRKMYEPSLRMALRFNKIVIVLAVVFLVLAGLIFSRMGGEFVPTLDEGDFVIQPVLKTGMSLEETVKMTTRIEKILKRFPEVNQVVSRIGAAEVPTDPMSMEESDVIITLFPKKQWTTSESKDGLADAFKSAILSEIPGIEVEFTQPIEMRFNELISGARSDLAVKIFGEDLDQLFRLANEIEGKIRNVEGAADIAVEKIEGLPQLVVRYDRLKMAKYGVTVEKLNEVLSMGFSGLKAGEVYESQRQFDLVLRYNKASREDVKLLGEVLITTANGEQLPLSEFAKIEQTYGPAKISRDNTKRRVLIGVNVRNRDLKSVVGDIQKIVDEQVSLPTGYYVEYGGQFKNLEQASARLTVAVPVALLLIFVLLYMAFNSFRDAVLIFSAIPLASIGGILALFFRGMPFSISAGVGFIALFGIAVLNGIVLVEHFKELKSKSMDFNELIIHGATDRLRPVLLTAIAAALGFLPMAVSVSAGAEVQKPLATVVIGGLITSTLLTLMVLPVLYRMFGSIARSKKALGMIILAVLALPSIGKAQKLTSFDELYKLALASNPEYQRSVYEVSYQQALLPAVVERSKTDFFYGYDQNNIALNNKPLHVVGLSQSFKMPAYQQAATRLQKSIVQQGVAASKLTALKLEGQLMLVYDKIVYLQSLQQKYATVSSTLEQLLLSSEKKSSFGGGNALDVLTVRKKMMDWQLKQKELSQQIAAAYGDLKVLLTNNADVSIQDTSYSLALSATTDGLSTIKALLDGQTQVATDMMMRNKVNVLPELNVTAFNGMNAFTNARYYPGIELGLSIPLFKKQYKARAEADAIALEQAKYQASGIMTGLEIALNAQSEKLNAISERMKWFEENQETNYLELKKTADVALASGEIDMLMYLLLIDEVRMGEIEKLQLMHEYNTAYYTKKYLLF